MSCPPRNLNRYGSVACVHENKFFVVVAYLKWQVQGQALPWDEIKYVDDGKHHWSLLRIKNGNKH